MANCDEAELMRMLMDEMASNQTLWHDAMGVHCHNTTNNMTNSSLTATPNGIAPEKAVYAYLTPFIIAVGVIGNAVSFRVFLCRRMMKLPASQYLAAICLSDLLVLVTYVLLDWLHKGLHFWPGGYRIAWIEISGVCEAFLFVSYTFRFTSAWLIVVFTGERYIAISRPLLKRVLCTRKFSRRAIVATLGIGLALSLYKPLASQSRLVSGSRVCSSRPDYKFASFVFDSAYGFLITAVPCILIATFNLLILRKLLRRSVRHREDAGRLFSKETRVRMEFTFILLAISSCFVTLNIPYFIVWLKRFLVTARLQKAQDPGLIHMTEYSVQFSYDSQLYITRTLFFFNYAVNFFLYCLTGKQYRQTLRDMCCCAKDWEEEKEYCTNINSSTTRFSFKNRATSISTSVL